MYRQKKEYKKYRKSLRAIIDQCKVKTSNDREYIKLATKEIRIFLKTYENKRILELDFKKRTKSLWIIKDYMFSIMTGIIASLITTIIYSISEIKETGTILERCIVIIIMTAFEAE